MPTLADALYTASQEWDDHKDGEKTYTRAQRVIELLTTKPETWDCKEVTPAHLQAVARTLSEHVSPSTVNRYIAAFRGMYRANCLVPPQYRQKKEPAGRQHIPTQEQLENLIDHMERRESGRPGHYNSAATAVVLLKETGLRAGELFAMTREDVDLDGNYLTVKDSKSSLQPDVLRLGTRSQLSDSPYSGRRKT